MAPTCGAVNPHASYSSSAGVTAPSTTRSNPSSATAAQQRPATHRPAGSPLPPVMPTPPDTSHSPSEGGQEPRADPTPARSPRPPVCKVPLPCGGILDYLRRLVSPAPLGTGTSGTLSPGRGLADPIGAARAPHSGPGRPAGSREAARLPTESRVSSGLCSHETLACR